jgi:AbrB family looped-hinge helix DNA binding protein
MTDSRHPDRPRERANERVVSAPIRRKGVVTIPAFIREQLNLEEGDSVIFTVRHGNIVITPARVIPRDQEWFWTPEWQAKEAEADAEIAAGEGTFYANEDEFLASLGED